MSDEEYYRAEIICTREGSPLEKYLEENGAVIVKQVEPSEEVVSKEIFYHLRNFTIQYMAFLEHQEPPHINEVIEIYGKSSEDIVAEMKKIMEKVPSSFKGPRLVK